MSDSERTRHGIDTLLDLVVYAPIGAFFHGSETLETLADKGRSQVANARIIGKLAVDRGRTEAAKAGDAARVQIADLLNTVARAAGAPMAGAPENDRATHDPVDEQPADEPAEGTGTLRVVPDSAPSVDELAIPDYDNLSASQVVPRLESLASDELAAVREYERAHRGRMTILSRIAQLEAS